MSIISINGSRIWYFNFRPIVFSVVVSSANPMVNTGSEVVGRGRSNGENQRVGESQERGNKRRTCSVIDREKLEQAIAKKQQNVIGSNCHVDIAMAYFHNEVLMKLDHEQHHEFLWVYL